MSDHQQQNESIHPGVKNGKRVFPLSNTAMPRRKGLSASKLAHMQEHMSRHPRDGATASRLAKNGK